MRFFFDGVPVIDTGCVTVVTDTISSTDSVYTFLVDPHEIVNYYHVPYKEKLCDACHVQSYMGDLTEKQPALCYQCHEDFADKYKVLHGPVAGGYCTSCHSPHFAKDSTLLIRKGQDLCLYCHKPGVSYDAEIHDGIEDAACTECHNPHGGDSKELFN
ncbi:MAG: hypothetical protein GXO47_08740 [Chlorobi bacterium]|nr:hypothetical protein [Chlorobiota bacterium]